MELVLRRGWEFPPDLAEALFDIIQVLWEDDGIIFESDLLEGLNFPLTTKGFTFEDAVELANLNKEDNILSEKIEERESVGQDNFKGGVRIQLLLINESGFDEVGEGFHIKDRSRLLGLSDVLLVGVIPLKDSFFLRIFLGLF